ncbi:hypothetical protein QFC22_003550 [Naganishia vaughanmartiniae]|uniref:Uncharacterized protein n=1 Tax=Naganishia vaughanmartiniae TaxID=1424756 RepID=A0ACC2X6M9_9TREE|nr:hypothetical protein QFC22_003550 [Naganishia vaughanmartiniae]
MKQKQPSITLKDRIRTALALEILERKRDEESVTACLLKWKQTRIIGATSGFSTTSSKAKPLTCHDIKLQVFAQSLQDANRHFAKLEAEVKTLKRKLALTEIDLAVKSKALNDVTEISGTVMAKPPIKRRKKATESLKDSTLDTSTSTPIHTDLTPIITSSPTTKNIDVSVLDQASGSNTMTSGKAASRKQKVKKASYVNVGTSTEGCLGVMGLLQKTDAVRLDGSKELLTSRSTVLQPTIIEDFRLIQTLLLPPIPCGNIPQNEEEHQNTLLDQALNVVSHLSQALQLAFASAAISQDVPLGNQQTSNILCAPDDSSSERTLVHDPTRMISLVTTLLSRFLPAILGRLEGSIAHGKVIFAVAKGVVKPAMDQISSHFSSTRRIEHWPGLADDGTARKFLQTIKELLESLLQVVPTYYLTDQGRSGKGSPFVEVIALCSAEALCTGIKSLKVASPTSITAASSTLDTKQPANNDAVVALVDLTRQCLPHLSASTSATGCESNSHISKRTGKSVATRICDSITQLVADMEVEVEVNSSIAAPSPDATVATQHTPNGKESDTDVQGSSNTNKQIKTVPLWTHLGIDRENMLATCRLAEGLMVRECQYIGDEVHGGMYDWLESLVR